MKQIYVGAVQRARLYTQIKKSVLPPFIVQIIVIALLILIPSIFHKTFFSKGEGNMSNIVLIKVPSGSGSAVYIGDNLLLSAAHVFEGMNEGDRCDVVFCDPDSTERPVQTTKAVLLTKGNFKVASSEDYALLRTEYRNVDEIAKPCPLGAHSMKTGEEVVLEGYPGGYSTTGGQICNIAFSGDKNIYMVDAKAWHGNSGGALKNKKTGELAGIVIEIGIKKEYNDNQTYVVKINHIKNELSKRGYTLQ